MKKSILFLVTLGVCLSNCGGGGGGGGDDTPDSCRAYCNYACQKVQTCHANTPFDVDACGDGCFERTVADGTSEDQCQRASAGVATLTCIELDTLLGLRNAALRSSTDIDGYEVGSELATKTE